MFLHLGGEVIVPKEEIVAIIDLESSSQAVTTKEFLRTVHDEGFVKRISEEGKEKSFIVTTKYIYLSPISSTTLMKRGNNIKAMLKAWEESQR
ncbi:conserved hypothetical protein [Heliomicrobium modesticaldum Ice1]|uniref:DUF370 domain-containing protein n=1 Tax=Heliobacterium modesticaldum (strain ATCC 51547 / Ice1) TaxID=498761 RepID=B0TAL1_HELMI|nr:DUF370 domain-containing protein [Heliomicrobium modesticaldum]ABZ83663.1 conserved hypothetical protein [Heliomicrobium modesticaldum Ice1]